jgi:hypothetical protein
LIALKTACKNFFPHIDINPPSGTKLYVWLPDGYFIKDDKVKTTVDLP